jgi:hypothetical protein
MKQKVNCWEFKKCGRERGGSNAASLGVCKAFTEHRLNGVHGGLAAGRACWALCGTLCGGEVQGKFAQKFANCEKCDFYLLVSKEEYPNFKYASVLRAKLKD